jgi:hypothetical protein
MEIENFKKSLKRLKKCDMLWDEMKPNEFGRLCQKCDKTIIDFSKMSFTEIALKMSETKEPTCGFYLPEQIEQINRPKINLPVSIGLTTLIATTSFANSKHTEKEFTHMCENFKKDRILENNSEEVKKTNDSIIISGKIEYYSEITNKIQTDSYAYIVIKGTKNGVASDENGNFEIKYLPVLKNEKLILIIGGIGFEQQEIEINTDNKIIDLGTISLKESKLNFSEFIVTGKRISFFGRVWRKITKPFR